MKMNFPAFLACLAFLLPLYGLTAAEDPGTGDPGTGLTLDACCSLAGRSNLTIARIRTDRDVAKMRLVQAAASFLPSVSAGGGEIHLNQDPPKMDFSKILLGQPPDIAGNPLIQYKFQDNYSAYLRVNWQVFTSGRNYSLFRIALADLRLQENRLRAEEDRLKVSVIRTFYGVVVSRQTKELTESTIGQIRRRLSQISNSFLAGSATEYDLLKVKVQLSSWNTRLASAERQVVINLGRLSYLIGRDPDSTPGISGELILSSVSTDMPSTAEEAVRLAVAGRPETAISRLTESIAKNAVIVKASGMLPQFSVQYNYNWINTAKTPSLSSSDWQDWWDVRLLLSWDIFTFGRKWADLRAGQLDKKGKSLDRDSLDRQVTIEARDAWYAAGESEKALLAAEENLQLNRLGYDLAKEKNAIGAITDVELGESELSLADARVQQMRALYDRICALAELRKATGGR